MIIRFAQLEDMTDWKIVAADVAEIFSNPIMADDPEFLNYAERKIKHNEALAAVDESSGIVFGFIGFSRTHNRITWFGVHSNYRNMGTGNKLLKATLNELDYSKEITVDTYRGNYLPGQPARHLYMKHGFVEIDNAISDDLGNERSKFAIKPNTVK